jgi:cell shape-determining protein MreC
MSVDGSMNEGKLVTESWLQEFMNPFVQKIEQNFDEIKSTLSSFVVDMQGVKAELQTTCLQVANAKLCIQSLQDTVNTLKKENDSLRSQLNLATS